MKLYDFGGAPNPRRLRIFLAEKRISVPTEQVDLMAGEQLQDSFRAINPFCTVPALELDDGTCISEVMAICRYFEALQPEPPLMGITPEEQGTIAMWEHRIEINGMLAVGDALRNSVDRFAGRAMPGPLDLEQIPDLIDRGKKRTDHFLEVLDERFGESEHLAGPNFSVADITALVAVDFAGRIDKGIPDSHANLKRWHDAVYVRPSAQA